MKTTGSFPSRRLLLVKVRILIESDDRIIVVFYGHSTENRSYNAADGITSIAGNATTQDLKGNLTEFEINGKEYDVVNYDLENRINKVDVDGTDVEYRYDAMGRRVLRKEGNTTTALIWWANSECAEHKNTANQTVIQNDIFEHPTRLNAVIARAIEGSKFKLQWFHKNYLDHVYAVSDDRGDFLEHYRYTAFGEVTIYDESGNIQQETQIDNDILWNTRRLDSVSGFYLYKYRHYSPELGRWLGRDPIEEEGGVNLYAFVGNDPIGRWDKLGNDPQRDVVPPPVVPAVPDEPLPPMDDVFMEDFDPDEFDFGVPGGGLEDIVCCKCSGDAPPPAIDLNNPKPIALVQASGTCSTMFGDPVCAMKGCTVTSLYKLRRMMQGNLQYELVTTAHGICQFNFA